MIDTDKYEGHTQGHWATTTHKGTWLIYTMGNGNVATINNYEDAKLIAHAPLLLAEVKRLRLLFHKQCRCYHCGGKYHDGVGGHTYWSHGWLCEASNQIILNTEMIE